MTLILIINKIYYNTYYVRQLGSYLPCSGFYRVFYQNKNIEKCKKKIKFFGTLKGKIRPLMMKFYPFKDPTSNFEPHSYENF